MADQEQGGPGVNTGRFAPGKSGNPKGRPRKQRADAALVPVPATPPPSARADGWVNEMSGHGTTRDRRYYTTYGVDVVTDDQARGYWRGDWLAARIIETLPSEAFRRGYELKLGDPKKTKAVNDRCQVLKLDQQFVRAAHYERAYGGAAIFPVLDGALGDFAEPLDEARIRKVLAYHVLEPRELQPRSYYTNLGSPKFRRPETYWFRPLSSGRFASSGWTVIHESRLAIFPGVRVSEEQQHGQLEGWGDSCLGRPSAVLRDFGLSFASAATLLAEHGHGVLALDGLSELLASKEGEDLVKKRYALMEMMKSSLRSLVIDKNDSYVRNTGTLAGVPETLREIVQLMAAAADMPVTKLMGMSPAGLNATGEYDERGWNARVDTHRVVNYKPSLEFLIKLNLLATEGPTGGKEPKEWSTEFRPLSQPSEKEDAERRYIVAKTDKLYFDMTAASGDDIAKSRFGGDVYSAEMQIDWAAREAQKKIDEERAEDLDEAARAALAGEGGAGEPDPDDPDDEATEPAEEE